MRILLSNDDGVDAPGLAALRSAVQDLGDVTVVAPASAQSAAGHAITVYGPLEVRRLAGVSLTAARGGRRTPAPGAHGPPAEAENAARGGFPAIAVDGRPADCVRLAIRNLLPQEPELILSGINHGANVGINVFYSGTVAAAAEGAMFGIPAIALSAALDEDGQVDYARAASLCRWVIGRLWEMGLTRGDLFNVNVPPLTGKRPSAGGGANAGSSNSGGASAAAAGAAPGAKQPSPGDSAPGRAKPILTPAVRFVPQSTAGMEDIYHAQPDPAGREMYRLGPDYRFDHQADTDVSALAEGSLTVTPLHVDMTNHDRLAGLTTRALKWRPPSNL
jgi:5'-nucleotidase